MRKYYSNSYCNNCNESFASITVVNLVRPSLPFVAVALKMSRGIVR